MKRAESLAHWLVATGTSQAKLAERLGVSRGYISLVLAGYRQPALDVALRIVAETGVPIQSLVRADRQPR